MLTSAPELLPVALDAVDLASRVLHEARGPGQLTSKGDRDYASELDIQVERRLRYHLEAATPHIGFFGEEEGATGHQDGLRWVLDPIDGTVNFVHGVPLYAVSLALVSADQPVLGVIDLPALGLRYRAATGQGAYLGDHQLPIPEAPADLAAAVVSVGDYAVGAHAEAKNALRISATSQLAGAALRIRMLGSAAIDLAWLAHGHLDATVTLSNNAWDMSAGVVLARETGHRVVDLTGDDYTLNSNATIAAHPRLIGALLAQLKVGESRAAGAAAAGRSAL